MKIVNRAAFLALPAGTLFSKYQPCVFGDLCVKGETIGESVDFFYQTITDAIDTGIYVETVLHHAEKDGSSLAMDFNCQDRDGMFDDDQLYAVWEREDVTGLITRLQTALQDGYK